VGHLNTVFKKCTSTFKQSGLRGGSRTHNFHSLSKAELGKLLDLSNAARNRHLTGHIITTLAVYVLNMTPDNAFAELCILPQAQCPFSLLSR
jgi:hypothetical protein